MDALHRILSGQCLTPKQIRLAGLFVILWFGMDFVEFIDWVIGKL